MRAILSIAAAAMVFAGPTAVFAQDNDPQTGSRLGNRLEDGNALRERDAIRATQRWAECIYFKRDRTVMRMLTSLDPADVENAALNVYQGVSCEMFIPGQSRADGFMLRTSFATDRGMFAEAALKKKGHLKQSAEILEALPMAEGYNRAWFALTTRSNTIDAMSICIAETQPALTVALLRTDRKSAEEDAAISDLSPYLGGCLVAGASLNANVFQLRNALADAYFQRIYGQNDPIVIEQRNDETAAAGMKS